MIENNVKYQVEYIQEEYGEGSPWAVVYNHVVNNQTVSTTLITDALVYDYFINNPERMPEFFLSIADSEGLERAVCDYISGMTDGYAVEVYHSIFVPRSWGG